MVGFIGKAIPLLFATPSALQTSRIPRYTGRGAISLQSTVNEDVPSTLQDVIDISKDTYRALAEGGCYIKEATPTITFQYTRPVAERTSDDSFVGDQADSWSGDSSQIYRKIQATHENTKPLLLYLPGLDGAGISALAQFDDLSDTFEFWRMKIDQKEDFSTFSELTSVVSNFVRDIAINQNRKVILVGESFGGLLAPSVAMRLEAIAGGNENTPVMGLVMVNPATSIYKTQWSLFAPMLTSLRHIEQEGEGVLPTPYSVLGSMALSLTVPDSSQYRNMFDKFYVPRVDQLQDIVTSMRDGLGILADNLPAKVIEHRVTQWCNVGSQVVNPRLQNLNVPTLFIGGDDDNMLPTKEEGERLVKLMPDCTSMSVKDSGHFLLDDRFNLTDRKSVV